MARGRHPIPYTSRMGSGPNARSSHKGRRHLTPGKQWCLRGRLPRCVHTIDVPKHRFPENVGEYEMRERPDQMPKGIQYSHFLKKMQIHAPPTQLSRVAHRQGLHQSSRREDRETEKLETPRERARNPVRIRWTKLLQTPLAPNKSQGTPAHRTHQKRTDLELEKGHRKRLEIIDAGTYQC